MSIPDPSRYCIDTPNKLKPLQPSPTPLPSQVYWTDTTGKMIRRANYDGSQTEIFLAEDMSFPEGLALDWVARNLYWTDSGI